MGPVTIILTTLNSEQFVARCVESCLNQTYQDLELLVVDGGSQDQTLRILDHYTDPRVRIIHQEDNAGHLPGAINLGLSHSQGDFLTWTQDDCWYEPDAIEMMLAYLCEHPDAALVYADYWNVDEEGRLLQYHTVRPPGDILFDDVVGVCFLLRREVYQVIGPQETQYHPVHEVPWRIRVAGRFQIQPLHIPLMYYTVRSGSLTGRIGIRELWRMGADVLLEEGVYDKRAYRHKLAQADIDAAFEAYILKGDYPAFWRHALAGIWRDWRWLRNRGLVKFMLMSFLPARDAFRNELLRRRDEENVAAKRRWSSRLSQELGPDV